MNLLEAVQGLDKREQGKQPLEQLPPEMAARIRADVEAAEASLPDFWNLWATEPLVPSAVLGGVTPRQDPALIGDRPSPDVRSRNASAHNYGPMTLVYRREASC